MNIKKLYNIVTHHMKDSQQRFYDDVVHPGRNPLSDTTRMVALVPRRIGATTAIMHAAFNATRITGFAAVIVGNNTQRVCVIDQFRSMAVSLEFDVQRDRFIDETHHREIRILTANDMKNVDQFRGRTLDGIFFDTTALYTININVNVFEDFMSSVVPCITSSSKGRLVFLADDNVDGDIYNRISNMFPLRQYSLSEGPLWHQRKTQESKELTK